MTQAILTNMLAKDCELIGLDAEPINSAEEFHNFHKQMNNLLRDIHADVIHLLEKGDEYSGFVSVSAIHKISNKPVHFITGFYGSLKDGQIYKSVNIIDYVTLLVQIGALEPDSIQRALSGGSVI